MFSPRLAALAAISTLVGSVTAAFQIYDPGPSAWWVASSDNLLKWTCNDSAPALQYTVLLNNTNASILTAPLPIRASLANSDCSETIRRDEFSFPIADGYTILFANSSDQRDILATSQPFEIKSLGSAYPSSATPSNSTPTSTTVTGSSSTGTPTSASKSNGASATLKMSAAGVLAAVGAAIGML
ncbi:hypothetical protein BC826DRAFT_360626 [Russula brevipes]|nr:hypothetical protein BC826DRAFT_360626 [Russula brevipes]